MKKGQLIRQIITSLTESLNVLQKAARASHEEATHESSRAESKYDTRGLEAAYLAGGQARQSKEILDSIKAYEALATRDFAPGEPIELTALVELDAEGTPSTYFIGPRSRRSGGLERVALSSKTLPLRSNTSQFWSALWNSMLVARVISSRPSSCNGRTSVQRH
jgi:hypothetical protein